MIEEGIPLPELAVGDLLIGRMMGAYTAAIATRFNSLPPARAGRDAPGCGIGVLISLDFAYGCRAQEAVADSRAHDNPEASKGVRD